MKVTEYFLTWHKLRKMELRPTTFEAEEIYLTRHLIPFFEAVSGEVEQIKPLHVQMYIHSKLESGRSDGKGGLQLVSVRKHLSVLRNLLDDAVVYGYLQSNPVSVVRIPKQRGTKKEREVFLSADRVRLLFQRLEGQYIKLPVMLALIYGLRRSEVLGLRWDSIDFRNNTLTVCHTVVKNVKIYASDQAKTNSSFRTFQLLPQIRDALLKYRRDTQSGVEYLFERAIGEPIRPDTLTRTFQRELARVGFSRMRFQDLRHSTASFLFDEGWSLEDVKAWLGHSDIETTSNIYLHYTQQRKVLLAKDLSSVFEDA